MRSLAQSASTLKQAECIQVQSIDFNCTILLLEEKWGMYLLSLALRNGHHPHSSNTDIAPIDIRGQLWD